MTTITDPEMRRKVQRALKEGNNCYTLDDLMDHIKAGTMQSHAFGNTWVITQVHEFPRRKSVDITYVVGSIEEALDGQSYIYNWAREVGADLITGVGRDGWDWFRDP